MTSEGLGEMFEVDIEHISSHVNGGTSDPVCWGLERCLVLLNDYRAETITVT